MNVWGVLRDKRGKGDDVDARFNRLTARSGSRPRPSPACTPTAPGLYLRVARGGSKSGCFRFMLDGQAREMGLGELAKVGLADARKKAADHRFLLADKVDPIEHRKAARAAKTVEAARTMTFDDARGLRQGARSAGATPNTSCNGPTRSPDMSRPCSAPSQSARSTWDRDECA